MIRSILSNSYLHFIISMQNVDIIKVETDVDIQSVEDPVAMENVEVSIPSAFSVKEDEPKVSHDFRGLL
jgi:hypothetical protein